MEKTTKEENILNNFMNEYIAQSIPELNNVGTSNTAKTFGKEVGKPFIQTIINQMTTQTPKNINTT